MLEELLNKLIKKGRVPFGENCIKEVNYVKHHGTLCWYFWGGSCQRWKPIRELVSKESNLWQFCVDNGLVRKKMCYCTIRTDTYELHEYYDYNYEYRLIEASLKNEDELEQFLLSNIVIKDEN